jgi:hypothetical protein
MERREFITLLAGAAAAWPLTARAQQSGKLRTIGFLGQSTRSAESEWDYAFAQRLRELGWMEGRTITIEYRWSEGRAERFVQVAAEFVRLNVDVIVTSGTPQIIAAKQATSVIPIVFATAGNPVGAGLVASLARPILPASGSNSCASLFQVCADWRSWPMSVIPSPCWSWGRLRRRPARSALRSTRSKFDDRKRLVPPSTRLKAAQRRFMFVLTG